MNTLFVLRYIGGDLSTTSFLSLMYYYSL